MGQHGRDSGSCSCSRLPHTPLGGEILDDAEGELRVLISNEVHSLFHCFTASLTHSFTASLCLCLQLHQPVLAVIDQPFRQVNRGN
jgi:hypothetical protein